MADYWYLDSANVRQGPVDEAALRALFGSGALPESTLVWSAGMANWAPATHVPDLNPARGATPPPVPAASGEGPLRSETQTWELFWRGLLLVFGTALVVPAPWVATGFWRYIARTTVLPSGRTFSFTGKPEDIWYVFVAQGVLVWLGEVQDYAGILASLLSVALSFTIVVWFCSHLQLPVSDRSFAFAGSFLGYLGWAILGVLSIITIIGWAWVYAAFFRWICRNVKGEAEFAFRGTGWEILWRTFAAILASVFIIPIPWVIKWITQWFVSQIDTRPAGGAVHLPGRV